MQPTITAPTADHSIPPGRSTLAPLQVLLLLIILLIGAALRLYNVAWDGGTLPHPDERSTVAFYAPSIRWPQDPSAILDPRRSTLNPFWDVAGDHRRSYTNLTHSLPRQDGCEWAWFRRVWQPGPTSAARGTSAT